MEICPLQHRQDPVFTHKGHDATPGPSAAAPAWTTATRSKLDSQPLRLHRCSVSTVAGPAVTTIPESKHSSLSEVATLLCSGSSVVERTCRDSGITHHLLHPPTHWTFKFNTNNMHFHNQWRGYWEKNPLLSERFCCVCHQCVPKKGPVSWNHGKVLHPFLFPQGKFRRLAQQGHLFSDTHGYCFPQVQTADPQGY